MVNRVLICSLLFIVMGCFTLKTENGNRRFKTSYFKIKQNSNNKVYKYIDTNVVYKLISLKYNGSVTQNYNYRKYFLKFYDKGRVGKFDVFDINDNNCINPKKADMGFYNFNDGILQVEFYHVHPQGNFFYIDKMKIFKDSIVGYDDKFKSESIHIKILIPKDWKRYNPDW